MEQLLPNPNDLFLCSYVTNNLMFTYTHDPLCSYVTNNLMLMIKDFVQNVDKQ